LYAASVRIIAPEEHEPVMNALTHSWKEAVEIGFRGASFQIRLGASRSFESSPRNVPILMSNSSSRLGALVGQWEVPAPDTLKARLQPEPEVEQRFYDSSFLASNPESSEDRSAPRNRAIDRSAQERRPTANAVFEIYQDESGGLRWRLQTEEGDVLAKSGSTYPSRAACRRVIDQVRDLSPEARVKERS